MCIINCGFFCKLNYGKLRLKRCGVRLLNKALIEIAFEKEREREKKGETENNTKDKAREKEMAQ